MVYSGIWRKKLCSKHEKYGETAAYMHECIHEVGKCAVCTWCDESVEPSFCVVFKNIITNQKSWLIIEERSKII